MNDHSRDSGGLVFTLIGTAEAVQQRLEAVLEPFNLSLAKLGILHHLASSAEPVSLSEIAARQKCVRSNITQIVGRLEKDGLVKRRPDPADRRGVQAVLTAVGRRSYRAGWEALLAEQHAIVRELGAGPADNLKDALGLLRK